MNTNDTPLKLYVELATLCNLNCGMCVKQSPGWNCADQLMSRSIFESLAPLFPHLQTLNLNGIGESLLHPDLPEFIRFARTRVPEHCVIGFQSNGMLLTSQLAHDLLDAGLNRICLSIDSANAVQLAEFRSGANLPTVENAFSLMRAAADALPGKAFSLGAETVVTAKNYQQLPELVAWCASRGVDSVIVTNMLPYSPRDARDSLYIPTAKQSLDFYADWQKIFHSEGLDTSTFFQAFYTVFRTPQQQKLVDVVRTMTDDARKRGLQFSLPGVMQIDTERLQKIRDVFMCALATAQEKGVQLQLPELLAREPRSCAFLEEPSLFVACDGALTPCYYLWHSYSTWLSGLQVQVRQRFFGRVPEDNPLQVWNSQSFAQFRAEARQEEFARCGDCNLSPCDYVQGFPEPFSQDCYGATVPCGICPWSGGGFSCLQ